jgi:hypothetical protein
MIMARSSPFEGGNASVVPVTDKSLERGCDGLERAPENPKARVKYRRLSGIRSAAMVERRGWRDFVDAGSGEGGNRLLGFQKTQ